MKIKLLAGIAMIACISIGAAADSPVARDKATVTAGNARFTVLTPRMIRIEYSDKATFEDQPTFTVVNRDLPVPHFTVSRHDGVMTISSDSLVLSYREGLDPRIGDRALTIRLNDGTEWHYGKKDSLNLKGTTRTLDGYDGGKAALPLDDGIISRSGWAVIDDSPATVRSDGSRSLAFGDSVQGVPWVTKRTDPEALDIYFLGYGHDYTAALGDYTRIAGKMPMPPVYVLGYWYSKFAPYSAEDYRTMIADLDANDINIDVMILDVDWHWDGGEPYSTGRGAWTGWTWNTNLIPDPEGLLKHIHDRGLHLALNLHPADGVASDEDGYTDICADLSMDAAAGKQVPWALHDKDFYQTFFKHIMRAREEQGVDFWWLDWQQKLTNDSVDGLGQTFWCNHVYFNDMKNNRPDNRPLIYHRWGGLGSHRYQIGFSGDTYINFETLAQEPLFTATASNVCYGYWGHDLGGHLLAPNDPNDPELLIRWMQFGVFTPIFRTHASNQGNIERRIWKYAEMPAMRDVVKLRYRLLPYIYAAARESYDTGVGICRPMYYAYPELEEAYNNPGQYFFGNDIIVAPVTRAAEGATVSKDVWLPEGTWYCPDLGRSFEGGQHINADFTLAQIPYFIRKGAVIPANPADVKRANSVYPHIILDVIAGADGEATLYEDPGDNRDYATEYSTTKLLHNNGRLTVQPRRGTFKGMPDSRSYTIRVHDGNGDIRTIEVPSSPCNEPLEISL
ncbi:MAG: glycoside hydrolase family 31 protein [Lachnoclostridium sp.]|nr:glycoside hydrolase family 31 protein [Lachnoclostridium sp.]